MNGLVATSPLPVSISQTDRLAREWVVRFAELYSVSLAERGPRFVELWVSAVADLAPETLDAACRKAMQTCKFFPLPAEIRNHIEKAEKNGFDLEAESEWHKLLAWIDRCYHPDVGIRRGAPSLPPQIEHAARAAGGYRYLESCSEEQLVWAKKAFFADLQNIRETGKAEHLLSDGRAKKIFRSLTAASNLVEFQKSLLPAEPVSASEDAGIPRVEVREVLTRVAQPKPPETEQERQERKAAMQHVLQVEHGYDEKDIEGWLAKHGLSKPANMSFAVQVRKEAVLQ